MKKKLFLFSVFYLLMLPVLEAKNINLFFNIPDNNFGLLMDLYPSNRKIIAPLSPPSVVAGNSCGPGIVNLSATGAVGETIEWFSSQTAVTPIFTGNNYSPTLSATTTFYVQSRSGLNTSTRIPVVGSVYTAPPTVTLSSSPVNSLVSPMCLGTSVTFTASGGADLFEFSVDGVVKQTMSSVRTYTTNSLTNGQVVSVRSRYAVNLDGSITETAWGTGALEDNVLSAALSGTAADGYINSFKISPTENKIVLGISGKAKNYRRIMIFLDTKPGGFNVSNYGDESGSVPEVRAFNFFNNNPSTFDSYFAADYCVAIATDAGEVNYYADVIELKTGNSIKTYLGTAATGVPTSVMGINKNNTGINDNTLGFEVEVSKALIGYTTGDIKFFAFTMQDNDVTNYSVTNSFLSPELTSTSSYGNGAVDYNFRDPNPVVVAGAALTPCYSTDSMTMSFASNPTPATVGTAQSKCILTSDPLGGNTPAIGTGLWTLKSGPGTVVFANDASGSTTATVSVKGTYVFTWTIKSGQCATSSADISVVYNITNAPTTGSATQNFCKINTPKVSDLVATGNNVQWFSNATGGSALAIGTNLVTGSYYAEQTDATTLCKSITRLKVDVNVDNPAAPVVDNTQTFCNTAKVSNLSATGTGIKWYADGTTTTPLLATANLTNGATYYASQTVVGSLSCESAIRTPTTVTINVTPVPTGSGNQTVCNSGTIASLVATSTGSLLWYANATGGSALLSSTVLVSGTTYYASQTISGCESATRYPLTVTVTNPQIPVSGGNQSVCSSSPLQTLTANASVTTGTVVWYDALINGNLVPSSTLNSVGSVTYYAQNTIGLCASTSRTAVVLEIKESPFLKIVSSPCSLDLLTYTINFTAASGSVITRLPAIGTIVGNSISGIPSGTDISITANKGNGCVETINFTAPNCSCSPVDGAISGGNKSVCEGQSNPSLSATVNAGETVDWYSSISGGSPIASSTLNYTPLNTAAGVYTYYAQARKVVDGCLSSGRTAVSLTITGQAAPTGSNAQSFCEMQNATVANLSVTGTNIKWYSSAVGTTALSSSTALVDGDYYATQSSTTGLLCESVNRLKVTVTIAKPSAPTGLGSQSFCESQNATVTNLSAIGTNIKWYSSAISTTALLSTTALVDGDYYATQTTTSGLSCESVNRLKVTVAIIKPAAPTGLTAQSFCEIQNATVTNLSATGTNIKWYLTASSTTALLSTTALVDGDYFATQSTATGLLCESVNRLKVTVTINKPTAPSGSGVQIVCNSGTIASLVATSTGSLLWYTNATGGSALSSSTVLVNGTTYYASQTVGGCESATRYPLTVTVTNPQIPVSGGNQSVCSSSPLQTLTATATVTAGTVVWYDALTNGSIVSNPTLNSVGSVTYYAQNTIGLCASTSRTAVVLEIKDSPFLKIVSSPCSLDLLTYTINFTAASGSVITRLPAIGTIVGNSISGIPSGTDISITANKGNGCVETINFTAPNCSCSPVDGAISGGNKSVCEGQSNPSLSATVNAGETVDWYSSISGGSPIASSTLNYTPLNTAAGVYTYYAQARKVVDGCLSSGRTAVSLTITGQAAPTGSNAQSFCEIENATVANLSVTGTNIKWYSSAISTTALSPAAALTDGDYYATQSSTTGLLCESVNRLKVTVTIDRPLPPVAGLITQPTCSIPTGSVMLNNLPSIGTWIIVPSIGSSISGSGTSYEFKNLATSNNYTFQVTNGNGCRSVLSTTVVAINGLQALPEAPIASKVVQPTCAIPLGSITIASQIDVTYSIDGMNFNSLPIFTGLSPKNYTLYVKNNLDGSCVASSIATTNINAVPLVPMVPSATNTVQPTCALQSGTITVALQSGVEYSVNGINYQLSNVFTGLAASDYTLYVKNIADGTCAASSSSPVTINMIPNAPLLPTGTSTQPTCLVKSGIIEIDIQSNSEYSIGGAFQDSSEFLNVQPGNYTLSIRFKNNTTCVASSVGQLKINAVPSDIKFMISGDCIAIPGTDLKDFQLKAVPLSNSYIPEDMSYEWKDGDGETVGTNSSVLNLSEVIKSSSEKEVFPIDYSLTVTPLIADCKVTNHITVQSVYCNIQKGISPDGNGSNDNFDLSNLNVRKLEIFNRYGLQVYSKTNYVDEWKGQTNNGDLLPSATYYYAIELENGEPTKTGWIYLIRDNN